VTRYVTHISAVLIVIDLRAKENRDRSSSPIFALCLGVVAAVRGCASLAPSRIVSTPADFHFPLFFFFFFVVIIIHFFSLGLFIFEMPAPILSSSAAIFLQRPFLEILFYFCLAFYCPFFFVGWAPEGRR
jgi:hypothetical protein